MDRSDLEQIILDYNRGISISYNFGPFETMSLDNSLYRLGQYIYVHLFNNGYVNHSRPIPLFDKKINDKVREFINVYSFVRVIKIWNELFDIVEEYEKSHKTTT